MQTEHAPTPPDQTSAYLSRDLFEEGVWKVSKRSRFGAVVFDHDNRVLLREPANHFDGYVWTFSKGAPDPDEHPVETALRETLEETGYKPFIIGHLPEGFQGGHVASVNYFYLAFDTTGQVDTRAMDKNGETSSARWVTHDEAQDLISQSTNTQGRERDLRTLEAAYKEYLTLIAT